MANDSHNTILLMPDTKSELWDMDSDIVSVTGVVISQGELTLESSISESVAPNLDNFVA